MGLVPAIVGVLDAALFTRPDQPAVNNMGFVRLCPLFCNYLMMRLLPCPLLYATGNRAAKSKIRSIPMIRPF
jgi:hypothetical protein